MAARAKKIKVSCRVNGKPARFADYPMARLLDVLRDGGYTGTKEGCGEGECGACSVMVDGELVNSCLIPLLQVQGGDIRTIEGVAKKARLHPVQQAFLDAGGAQCGICTPGMVMASLNLLKKNPRPSEAQIREGLAGNLCRCTGYMGIFAALALASKKRKA